MNGRQRAALAVGAADQARNEVSLRYQAAEQARNEVSLRYQAAVADRRAIRELIRDLMAAVKTYGTENGIAWGDTPVGAAVVALRDELKD